MKEYKWTVDDLTKHSWFEDNDGNHCYGPKNKQGYLREAKGVVFDPGSISITIAYFDDYGLPIGPYVDVVEN